MGVTIFVWLPSNGNVGHASMMLSDGTYISWWPEEEKCKKSMMKHMTSVKGATADSYEEDCYSEGKYADHMIPIKDGVLGEGAIKTWWVQFVITKQYHLLYNNCCTAIFEALNQGGAQFYVKISPLIPVPKPANIKEYAEKLKLATG